MFQVKKFSPKDMKDILDFISKEHVQANDLHNYLEDFLICRWDTQICGLAYGKRIKNALFIKHVFIKEEYRNKGLGSLLIKAFINIADNKKIEMVFIYGENENFINSLRFCPITSEIYDEYRAELDTIYGQSCKERTYYVTSYTYFDACNCQ